MAVLVILILWVLGFGLCYALYKAETNNFEKNGLLLGEDAFPDKEDINTIMRHFKKTALPNCIALVVATFIPFQLVRWLCAIACGMVLPPVFYDALYTCLPKIRQSKTRLFLAVVSTSNLLLIIITINHLYWAYIHKVF